MIEAQDSAHAAFGQTRNSGIRGADDCDADFLWPAREDLDELDEQLPPEFHPLCEAWHGGTYGGVVGVWIPAPELTTRDGEVVISQNQTMLTLAWFLRTFAGASTASPSWRSADANARG